MAIQQQSKETLDEIYEPTYDPYGDIEDYTTQSQSLDLNNRPLEKESNLLSQELFNQSN